MSTPPQNSLVNQNPALGSPFARKMRSMGSYLRQHWVLYLMLVPGLFFLFIYKLLPLWGLQIAFKNYKIFAAETPWKAIAESAWVGMKHFNKLFASSQFKVVLRNTLEINFVINNADIQGEGNYVVITKQYADERGLVSKTIEQSAWERFNDTRKYVSFTVSAKEMNDPLTATVYNAEGKQISEVYHDSVAGYCVRMLGMEEEKASPVMKKMTLFVDMVNYGAAAQLEWGYNVENLANAGLTEQQQGYATQVEEDASRNILDKGTGYAGTTLSLKENILLNIVFQNATIDKAAYATVSYTGYKGRAEDEVSYRVEAEQFQALGNSMKYVQINTLKVADYAQAVTVTLYDADGNEVSKCVESIESYLMRNYNKTILNPATLAFCEGAYEYLK